MLRELRTRTGLEIGDNEPYVGHLRNDSVYRHATLRGLPNALVEIRQDQIREAKGQSEWAGILAECLTAIFGRSGQRRPAFPRGALRLEIRKQGLRPRCR